MIGDDIALAQALYKARDIAERDLRRALAALLDTSQDEVRQGFVKQALSWRSIWRQIRACTGRS
jgi:hypothetical protein